jgi:hypothetical protein
LSYDLSFAVPKGREPPSNSELERYFQRHGAYSVEDNEARYANERTGTYFTFAWGVRPLLFDTELDKRGLRATGISFDIKYARPHTFALEADIELAALVNEFALQVDDPQSGGMGIGEYDPEGFVRAWNAGSQGTLGILVSSIYDRGGRATELNVLPMETIERFWKWNYLSPALEARRDWFVSQVHFHRDAGGSVRSFVYWPNGLPTALPEVDDAVLVDTETDKRVLVTIEDLAPVRERSEWSEDVTRHLPIDDDESQRFVLELLAKSEPLAARLMVVAADEILDFEWIRDALLRLRDG